MVRAGSGSESTKKVFWSYVWLKGIPEAHYSTVSIPKRLPIQIRDPQGPKKTIFMEAPGTEPNRTGGPPGTEPVEPELGPQEPNRTEPNRTEPDSS